MGIKLLYVATVLNITATCYTFVAEIDLQGQCFVMPVMYFMWCLIKTHDKSKG